MLTPSLRFLKTFHIAARLGSFKAAADELSVTASAVSHQMKVLEEQLGLSLFERGPRSLSLTPAGANYFEHIDALFSRLDSVTAQLRLRFSREVVRLQVPPFFASELLLPRLSGFSVANPNEDHSPDADVSIVCGAGQWPDVQATKLFRQAYVAACAPQMLRRARIRCVADLAGEPLIAHHHRLDLWDRWAAMFGDEVLRPKQLIQFSSMS